MPSFKDIRRRLYCSSLDVRMASALLEKKDLKLSGASGDENTDPVLGETISDVRIEHFIMKTDGMIRARLAPIYSEGDFLISPPFAGAPMVATSNQVGDEQIMLTGVNVGTGAVTELWKMIFDQANEDNTLDFRLFGSMSGFQGVGAIDTDFMSTNGDIVIPLTYWQKVDNEVQFARNDRIYIITYNINPTLVYISSQITCATILRALTSDQSPNSFKFIDKIEEGALKLLNDLAEGKIQLQASQTEIPPDAYAYQITSHGSLQSSRMNILGSESESWQGGGSFDGN